MCTVLKLTSWQSFFSDHPHPYHSAILHSRAEASPELVAEPPPAAVAAAAIEDAASAAADVPLAELELVPPREEEAVHWQSAHAASPALADESPPVVAAAVKAEPVPLPAAANADSASALDGHWLGWGEEVRELGRFPEALPRELGQQQQSAAGRPAPIAGWE